MKARINIDKIKGITEFDISAPIIPVNGASGITFENRISDFESVVTANFFENHKKNATFSNYGFYMFLLKLSLHFTRIQEKVDRG